MGSKVCGCIIGTGNSIERFCISLVESNKISWSVKAHTNKPKANTAPPYYAWYVTTTLRGRSGGPAAHPSFWVYFEEDEKTPQEWEALFDRARLAQAIGEQDATLLVGDDVSGRVDPLKYVTPRKSIWKQYLHQDDSPMMNPGKTSLLPVYQELLTL
jgi:hypothetical protein